jgi:hypothetical protein
MPIKSKIGQSFFRWEEIIWAASEEKHRGNVADFRNAPKASRANSAETTLIFLELMSVYAKLFS